MESTVAIRKVENPTTAMSSACTNALTQYDQRFMARYLEDCKNDPNLQIFDKNLEKRTKALIAKVKNDGGLSLQVCDEIVTTMSDVAEGTANAVVNYKSQMIGMKDDSYHGVLKEYLGSSLEILNFCTAMEKFVDEARETHSFLEGKISFIEGKIQNCSMSLAESRNEVMEISNILKNKDRSAQILREMVHSLLQKQENLLQNVSRLLTKQKSVEFWKKLTSYLFISVKTLGVVLAAILPTIAGMISTVKNMFHWSFSPWQGMDSKKDALKSMREGSLHCVRDMEEIQASIDGVINDMDTLLASTKVTNGTILSGKINNIKHKLEKYSKKLADLEKKTEECSSRTKKAREMLF
ncbi:hypothetical protein M0R45_008092 [Rubus argutus]|uniref:Uncharacterized protein n=1 Tax=Rubus argutus TaxID=59490 RepID=A0AAW1Y0C0_RUBAR